jgi:hypothetical protein
MSDNPAGFSEEEMQEARALQEQDTERRTPAPKKSVKIFIDPEKFKRDIQINPNDLSAGFMEQASLSAYYGMQRAKASEQVDNLKLLLNTKEAILGNKYRDQLTKSGVKATETAIANAIAVDAEYIRVRKALNEAKGVLEMLEACYDSFRHRKDMLVQMGAASRVEMQGELHMKSVEAKETDLRNRTRRMPGAVSGE